METAANPDIKRAVTRLSAQITQLQPFYDYYNGAHQLNFASEKFKNKFGKRLQNLRENLCRTVVKAPASRLEAIGFQADAKEIQQAAWAIWKQNNLPFNAGKVHREAFKTGASYVIVWADKRGKARVYPQVSSNVAVWRDSETGEINKAAKLWMEYKHWYLTLYYPDRIEKYISQNENDSANFIPRAVEGEEFPLKNEYSVVPVFEFVPEAESDDRGVSILSDVIPLNDALNKSWCDIFVAQEDNARRQRFAAGLQVEVDEETGKKINPFKPDDDVWIAGEETTKFGEFTEVNLEQLLKIKQEAVRDIALVAGIPPSYFNLDTANFPSGEALRKIEARFTAIVGDAQRSFGESWAEVVKLCLQIEEKGVEGLEIETQWTDAAPVSDAETLDNAMKKKNLGWSVEQIQRDYGLSEEQIKKMGEENGAREKAKVEQAAKFFDGGNSLMS
jgi:hypothetical protein